MGDSVLEPEAAARSASLEAQRAALVAQLEMHISRSEDLAAKVAEIDRELEGLEKGGDT
jgi:hypothetical protein